MVIAVSPFRSVLLLLVSSSIVEFLHMPVLPGDTEQLLRRQRGQRVLAGEFPQTGLHWLFPEAGTFSKLRGEWEFGFYLWV